MGWNSLPISLRCSVLEIEESLIYLIYPFSRLTGSCWLGFRDDFAVNFKECLMTRIQKMTLDYHFKVEQEAGSSTFAFFGFNGIPCYSLFLFILLNKKSWFVIVDRKYSNSCFLSQILFLVFNWQMNLKEFCSLKGNNKRRDTKFWLIYIC